MSSVSSALTSLASVSTMDFVRPLLGRAQDERFYLSFSKGSTVFWAGALMLVAYLTREVEFVLNAAFSLRGLTSGALLGGLLLTLFWRKGNAAPVVVAMIVSLLFMIGVNRKWFWKTMIDWPWYTLIGTGVTLAIACCARPLLPARPSRMPACQAAPAPLQDETKR
jgi:Na+/proline symporter